MKPEVFLNQIVSMSCGVHETKGKKIGLELELEGRNVAMGDVATRGWQRKHDGSLRGEAIEYITAGAKEVEPAKKLVAELFGKFKENGVKFNDSIRTSTHVHLNFSDKPVKAVINFFALFTMLEEVLQYYSGEDRKGNLFCISTREAEGIVGVLADAVAKGDLSRFAGDRYKYAACNLSTLYKFGTAEIRTMKGATSAEQVNAWIDILNDMYEYSLNVMKSPADIVKDLSYLGAEGLMKKVFSPKSYKELMRYFPAPATLHYSLMEGARVIQVFAYEFEEAFNAVVEIKEMPKGDAKLPGLRPGGRPYAVYNTMGRRWLCMKDGPGVWKDGDRCRDDRRIQWSGALSRFIVVYPDGEVVPLLWSAHHEIPDEVAAGAVFEPRPMPPELMGHGGDEEDNDEDMEFDEGDDF